MCSTSLVLSTSSDVKRSVLCKRVHTTERWCSNGWFDSQFRYWSVCVAFRYTFTLVDPSSFRHIHVFRKASVLFCPTSTVISYCVPQSSDVVWTVQRHSLEAQWMNHPRISTRYMSVKCFSGRSFLTYFHLQVRHYWGHWWTHGRSLLLLLEHYIVTKICDVQTYFLQIADLV